MHTQNLDKQWIKTGVITGFLSAFCYFGAVLIPLPRQVSIVLAFLMGPLLSIAFIGFYHFFKIHRNSIAIQASALFGIIAGVVVNLMLVVQQTIIGLTRNQLEHLTDETSIQTLQQIKLGLDTVHLGLDISWDLFISFATILLGIAMFSHPKFGKIFGSLTILVGVLLIGLNMFTFPVPPDSAGLFDIGPFVGLFYVVICIQVLRQMKWVDGVLAGNS